MSQVLTQEMRNRRSGANRAPAIRNNSKAERIDFIDSQKVLQAQRIRASLHCTEYVARELARLVYGEGQQR